MSGSTWDRAIDVRKYRGTRAAAWVFAGLFLALSVLGAPIHSHTDSWADPVSTPAHAKIQAPTGTIVCGLCLFAHSLRQLLFPGRECLDRPSTGILLVPVEEAGCIGTKISLTPPRAPPLGATIFAS